MTCSTCPRWRRHPGASRFGRCAKPRSGPMPYWFGTLTTHDQIDTVDEHGTGCAARPQAPARRPM